MLDLRPSFDTRRPFTRAQALAAGITPKQLRGPRFRRVLTGVYVDARVPHHPVIRVAAALLIHPADAFASHVSAGRVHGVPLPLHVFEHVSVFADRDRRRRPEIRNHIAAPDAAVVVRRGLRVSSPAQMFVELAEILGLVDLVVVGDALVRQHLVTPDELRAWCATSTHPGAAAARRAAAYVREEVDSPMETRLRMLIVLAGLPEPEVNHKIRDPHGRVVMRFDLSYPDLRIVIEYDGRQHRDDLDQWDRDEERKDWFDDGGWRHVPVFSRGIYRRPDRTLARVCAALESRGVRFPQLGDGWRPHFPVH